MAKKRNNSIPIGGGDTDIVELENSNSYPADGTSGKGPVVPNNNGVLDISKSKLLSQIGRNRTPADGEDPMNLINVEDFQFQGNPAAQDPSTYYPSQSLSPAKIDQQPGRYFASMPLKQGGQVLYPMGLADARKNAIENAAYKNEVLAQKKKNSESTFFDKYKMLQGLPAYQDKLDNYFQTEIIDGVFNKAFDKYGKYAVNRLSDPSTPEYQELIMKYHQYETLTNASKTLDGAVQDALKRKKDGETLSQDQEKLIGDYYQGNLIYNDKGDLDFNKLLTAPGALKLYDTGWSRMKDLQPFIDDDMNSYYEKGIDIVGADGKTKHVDADGSVEFYNLVKEKGLPPEKIDQYAQYLAADPNLSQPGLTGAARIEYWKKFVQNNAGRSIEQSLTQVKQPGKGKGNGAGGNKAGDLTWIIDDVYNSLTKQSGEEQANTFGQKNWVSTPLHDFEMFTGKDDNGKDKFDYIDKFIQTADGKKFYTLKGDAEGQSAHPYDNLWNEVLVPSVNKKYGAGAVAILEKFKDHAIEAEKEHPGLTKLLGIPVLKTAWKEGDEQAVQGGTAVYKDGKWVMKQ